MSEQKAGAALIYCRVSTFAQEQDGTSLDSQEAAGRTHAKMLGYAVGRVTREVCSGATFYEARPDLSRDLADIRAGQFQAVVIHDTDRLSRDDPYMPADVCARMPTGGSRLHLCA